MLYSIIVAFSITLLGNGNAKISKLDEKVQKLELQNEAMNEVIEKLIKEKNEFEKTFEAEKRENKIALERLEEIHKSTMDMVVKLVKKNKKEE